MSNINTNPNTETAILSVLAQASESDGITIAELSGYPFKAKKENEF